ncbi:helix-turn-helix transcriptional regulator [Vitreimonas flagellata]|jgi:AraC-like DNA-binding protein|uniref:helix-turn-helix transcriptional regulator n=1 Tax=Vitreimonas flagellata TaxID=2560861 RepID=UPI0010752596|nr:helix-turn-helix domain-containing protein [Vitreimonas flagellata]
MNKAAQWRGAARIGPWWAAFLGAAGDNDFHSHHAIQAFAGPHALLVDASGQHHGQGFVAPANLAHRATAAYPSSFLYVDPDSPSGRRIAHAIGDRISVLSPVQAEELATIVETSIADEDADPSERLAHLLGAAEIAPTRDARIGRALAAFHESEAPLDARAIARALNLSQSRAAHLFRDEIGMPIRSFLLWSKLRRAMTGVAQGLSLTEAAHHGGFADSAHFSRTCVRMFGASPLTITGAIKFDEM